MPTNSTFGWPITNKNDMFKPTAISALEGAAFDTRITLERDRHELRVSSTGSLPGTGAYVGQQAWVNNRNRPYYWTGSAWRSANGVEGGTIFLTNVKWTGSAPPLRWSGALNISLPSGRFTATPIIVTNAFAANRVIWSSLSTTPSGTSSFQARLMCVAPGATSVRLNWVAVDSN